MREKTMTATARLQWHPPQISEFDDHTISPPATRPKFWIDRKYPKGTIWPEILHRYRHQLELANERQFRWREEQRNPSFNASVPCDDNMLNALVRWGKLDKDKTDDPKVVGKAILEVMMDLVKNDPYKPSRW
jgi:hypothetical protein